MGNPRLPVYGSEKPKRLPKDLTGMVFGRLKVLELVPNKDQKVYPKIYKCQCACGTFTHVRRDYLVGGTRSCGCNRTHPFSEKPELRKYEAIYRTLLYMNKHRCLVDLTYEEFLKFVDIKNCHYCGCSLHWQEWADRVGAYNLDRKDNTRGYSTDNCVVCCKRCNFGKGDRYSYDEWYGMTRYFREKCAS